MKYDLKKLFEVLLKDRKFLGLIRVMKKPEIVKIMSRQLNLHPKNSAKILDLISKNTNDTEIKKEGIPFGSYDRGNHGYPISTQMRKSNRVKPDKGISYFYQNKSDDDEIEPLESEAAGNPMGKTYPSYHPGATAKFGEFPPDYLRRSKEDKDWPYDDATVQWSKRKNLRRQGFTR